MAPYKGLIAITVVALLTIGSLSTFSVGQRPPVGGGTTTSTGTSSDQGGRPAPLINNDWHLLQFGQSIVRYNSMNGNTQMMSMDGQGKMAWRNFAENSGTPIRGNAGRFHVMTGQSPIGGLVRVDTQSGETWGIIKPAGITAGDLIPGGAKASDLTPGNFGFYKYTFN